MGRTKPDHDQNRTRELQQRARDVETSIRVVSRIGLAVISIVVAETIHKFTIFLAEKLRNYASDSVADSSFKTSLIEHTITSHIANTLARFFGAKSSAFEIATGSLFSVLSYFSIKNREPIDAFLVPLTVLLTQRLTVLFEEAYMRWVLRMLTRNSSKGRKSRRSLSRTRRS